MNETTELDPKLILGLLFICLTILFAIGMVIHILRIHYDKKYRDRCNDESDDDGPYMS